MPCSFFPLRVPVFLQDTQRPKYLVSTATELSSRHIGDRWSPGSNKSLVLYHPRAYSLSHSRYWLISAPPPLLPASFSLAPIFSLVLFLSSFLAELSLSFSFLCLHPFSLCPFIPVLFPSVPLLISLSPLSFPRSRVSTSFSHFTVSVLRPQSTLLSRGTGERDGDHVCRKKTGSRRVVSWMTVSNGDGETSRRNKEERRLGEGEAGNPAESRGRKEKWVKGVAADGRDEAEGSWEGLRHGRNRGNGNGRLGEVLYKLRLAGQWRTLQTLINNFRGIYGFGNRSAVDLHRVQTPREILFARHFSPENEAHEISTSTFHRGK